MKTKFSETLHLLIDGLSASGIYNRHIDESTLYDGFLDEHFDYYIHGGIILSHYYIGTFKIYYKAHLVNCLCYVNSKLNLTGKI